MQRGDDLLTTPPGRVVATSFDQLYSESRGEIFRALATITNDRDLATESVDAGFTAWRRRLRKPKHVSPDVGVMALAFKWAHKQMGKKSRQVSGFRLSGPPEDADPASLDRFKQLSFDERGLLVMRSVLGWNDSEISHALAADGVGPATRALLTRLEGDGYDYERMARALQARAATFVEPLTRLDAVKTKGAVQKIGAFAAGGALMVATVAGAVTVIGNAGSSPPQPPSGSAPPTGAAPGPALTADNVVWERVPLPVSGDNIMALAHDGTDFYLLGTDGRGRPVMMRSSSGLDWLAAPGPPGAQNMWFQQMVATPDVLVVVGGGVDERRGGESTLVYVSKDRETWSQAELPLASSVEIAGRVIDLHTWVASAAVTDSGFTIIGQQGAEFNPEELLREVVDPELLRHGWGQDPNGMQFYDNQGRVALTMTWEELDLDPELVALITGNRSIVWTSEDGVEWKVAETAGPPGVNGIGNLAKTSAVSAALAYGEFGPALWLYSDEEWVRPVADFTATALTTWNDQLIVAGAAKSDGRPGVWRTSDGITWEQADVPAGIINQFFTSGDGIVGIGYGAAAGVALGPAEIQAGAFTVLASSDGKFQVIDSEGTTVVEVFEEDVTRAEQITITHPETGEIVVEFDERAFEEAWEAIYREAEFGNPGRGGRPEVNILLSQDGSGWTALPLEDPSFHPSAIALGNGSMLLVGWSEGGGLLGFGGGGQQMLLARPG